MSYQQKQKFQEVDKQALVELQYVVFTDLQNFIGILAETYAVTQQVDRNDPLYLIHINRLITQVNLSKCIHFDTQQSSQNKNSSQYKDLKNKSFNVLSTFLQQFKMNNNPDLQQSLQDYQTILSNPIQNLRMKELHQIPQQNETLDQSVVSDILGSISQVDNDYDQMRAGKKTFNFDEKQLFQKTESRFQQAIQKIQVYKSGQNQVQNPKKMEDDDDQYTQQQPKQYQENQRKQTEDNQQQNQHINNGQMQNTLSIQIFAIQEVFNNKEITLEEETIEFLKFYYLYLQDQLDVNSQDKLEQLISFVKRYKTQKVNRDLQNLSELYKNSGLIQVLDKIWHLINVQDVVNQYNNQMDPRKIIENNKKGNGTLSYK